MEWIKSHEEGMTCYMEVYAQRAAMKASFASIQQESAANRGTERRAVRTAVVNTGDLLEDEKVEGSDEPMYDPVPY